MLRPDPVWRRVVAAPWGFFATWSDYKSELGHKRVLDGGLEWTCQQGNDQCPQAPARPGTEINFGTSLEEKCHSI
eukprot:2416629-Alexandrium_andersonii.AAC.1